MRYHLRTLLIVLAVGPLVIAGLYWARPKVTPNRPEDAARAQIEMLCDAVQFYELRNGVLPADLDALEAQGMVLKGLPTDPWGNDFHFAVTHASSGDFIIWSRGRDGISPTPDDVTGVR